MQVFADGPEGEHDAGLPGNVAAQIGSGGGSVYESQWQPQLVSTTTTSGRDR